MTSVYCGCDPGLSGGFAVVSGNKLLYKMAMPTITFHNTKNDKTKTEIDREGVLSFLKTLPEHTHVAIEQAQAFRNQSITSTCTTCKNYGILLMALTVAHMYTTEVPPADWQTHFGIVPVKKGDPETTKVQAYRICRLHYHYESFRESQRASTPHDGIVDAVLIAEYCQYVFAPDTTLTEPLKVAPIPGVEGIVKPLKCESDRTKGEKK